MVSIYDMFAGWQKINKEIPLEKFCEGGRMTEKQKHAFLNEVSLARILYKDEETHVIELQISNIYPQNFFIYGWLHAVFQTMPYEIIIILNCRYKYYLLLIADTQDRKNSTSVATDKIVTNMYCNGVWVDGKTFDEIDLLINGKPIAWDLFPSIIRVVNPNGFIEFTDDNDEVVKLPYPQRYNVSEDEIDEYIDFAKREYELNTKNEFEFLFDEELEDALSFFWHQTENNFRIRNDTGVFGFSANSEKDEETIDKHSEVYWGFIDGELLDDKSYQKYMDDCRNS